MNKMNITRRQFMATTSAVTAAALSCGLPTVVLAQEKVLRLRIDGDNNVLDPGYMSGGREIETQKQCLPFLAQYTQKGGRFDWEPTYFVNKLEQRSPTEIDFELNENLLWSDDYGPVTASDVKYSYERMKETDWSGYFDVLERVEVTGERSGTIVLNKPFAPFIMITLCHGPGAILSEKAMKAVGGKFTTKFPAVCGPYTYESVAGQRATFKLNPLWKGPTPDYTRIEANIITEIKAAELAFDAGEIDCTEVGSDTIARYQKQMPADTQITTAGQLQYMWLGMNTQHDNLKDINVRRAIQHAVDVDSILQGAYSGTTAKSNGIICPGLTGHRQETRYYQYDPEKAKEYMDKSGVSNLQVTLRTLNNQERMLAAQIIQANLAVIGIQVKVIPTDSGPYWEMGQESKGEAWKDLELWLMRFGTTPDPYEATQWFVSSQIGVWNWERWSSEEFDALYEQGVSETDEQKRHEIYVRMQEIMEETGAYVWINHEPEAFVHTTSLEISAAPSGELNYRRFKSV